MLVVVIVRVEEPELVMEAGVKTPVAAGGSPSRLRVTTPAKLLVPATMTVKTVPSPPTTVCVRGEDETTKVGRTTLTLSNVTVLKAAVSCEQTARPTRRLLARLRAVMLVAVWVHDWPSLERQAVTVLPERTSRTQCGTVGPLTSPALTARATADERYGRETPCEEVGVT